MCVHIFLLYYIYILTIKTIIVSSITTNANRSATKVRKTRAAERGGGEWYDDEKKNGGFIRGRAEFDANSSSHAMRRVSRHRA